MWLPPGFDPRTVQPLASRFPGHSKQGGAEGKVERERGEVTERWRKLCIEKFYDLHFSPDLRVCAAHL